VLIKNIYLGQI